MGRTGPTARGGSRHTHAARVKALRRTLASRGHDAMLVTDEADVQYLTGFQGEATCLVVTPRRLVCISDARFEEELGTLAGHAEVAIRRGPMPLAQIQVLGDLKARAIAIQAQSLSVEARGVLAKGLGARRLQDSVGLIAALRIIKDESEVRTIRAAVRIQERALLATLPHVKPGMREIEIAARLEFECRTLGAQGMSFPTIVAAGANGSKPHYRAGAAKAAKGRTLLIDWGCRLGGYCSDMTRTFALGRWPARLAEVYRLVLAAHDAGVDAVRAGVTCAQVDAAARGVIERAGLGDRFGHGLGHGIGLNIHEAPRLFRDERRELEAGMIVTVEPGVYFPGVGGVRIEDDILVTSRGGRRLCSLPRDMRWATLDG